MVESQADSTSRTTVIQGSELTAWRRFKTKLDLTDIHDFIGFPPPTRFTYHKIVEGHLIQSPLDRMYTNDGGWWISYFKSLMHTMDRPLSDHGPVLLQFAIEPL